MNCGNMRSDVREELAEFRREVKTVLDAALSETDAPLAVGDLRCGLGLSAPQLNFRGAKSTKSCRICADGENDLGAVDRELALLEQSNAALFKALAQTRAVPSYPLPPDLDATTRSRGAHRMQMDRATAQRLRKEAAQIQERESRSRYNSRRLVEHNRELKHVVSDLQRQKNEVYRQMEEKRARREEREAESRRRNEKERLKKEKALRVQMSSTVKEADRLRAELKARTTREERACAKEALWRWRASAAASVAARERRARLAAEATAAAAAQESAIERQRGGASSSGHDPAGERDVGRTFRDRAKRERLGTTATAAAEADVTTRRRAVKERAARHAAASVALERDPAAAFPAEPASPPFSAEPEALSPAIETISSGNAPAPVCSAGTHPSAPGVTGLTQPDAHKYERRGCQVSTSATSLAAGGKRVRGSEVHSTVCGVGRGSDNSINQRRYHGEAGKRGVPVAPVRCSSSPSFSSAVSDRHHSQRRAAPTEELKTQEQVAVLAEEQRVLWNRVEEAETAAVTAGKGQGRTWGESMATREGGAKLAAGVTAGVAIATMLLARSKRRATGRAFTKWERANLEARLTFQHAMREAAFRKVVTHADNRLKEVRLKALQRWRLATAMASMQALQQRQRRASLARGTAMAEALLRRRGRARLAAGFQCWRDADAELVHALIAASAVRRRRASAVNTIVALLHRRRRVCLRQAFGELHSAARVIAERERREEGARVLAARKQRTTRTLLMTRCWGAWTVSTVASRSARRLDAAVEEKYRAEAEKKGLRLEGLAWACKSAVAGVEARRKARAWLRWRGIQVASLAKRQAVRILGHKLRSSRQGALARAMVAWRLAASKRLPRNKSLQSVAIRRMERQRLFLLGKAWSKLVWSARERQAARAQKLGAARAVHVLLASAARASRREAFLRWRGAIAAAAATSRLQNSRLVAIQRCASGQRLRELGVAWRTLSSNSRQARLVVTAVARIEGMLFRARQRSVSHRLGVWRSEALAGAIADGEMHTVLGNRHAAVRLLAGTIARVEQRRLASGWRALTLFVAERRRAEAERASMSVRAPVLLQRSVERVTRREVGKRFRRWREVVADRRLQGAVGAARATLEGEKAVLAAELMKLKRHGAVLLLASFVDRCERRSLQRGWSALRQATHRRAILVRLTRLLSRSRSQFLRVALHRWRVAATEIRAAQARAQAQRSVLAASLAGARVRNVQPAFAAWSHLVARESEEEDEFADHGDGLLRFAVLLSRVGERRDRARTRRALVVWRLGAAQLAVLSAQQEAKVRGDLASAAELEKASLLAAQPDFHHAGARLAMRWLHRQQLVQQVVALRHWKRTTSEDKVAEERENWRMRASLQLARELARVEQSRRRRILRRTIGLWHHRTQQLAACSANKAQDERRLRAGARRLSAAVARSLLRRKARVWARLMGSAVATYARVEREREAQVRRERFLASAEARSARRILAGSFLVWKGAWAENKHRGELHTLRAQQGAAVVATVARRKDGEALRGALMLWRARGREARERERALVRLVACFQHADARVRQARAVRCLAQWRLRCVMHGKAAAEEGKASAETAFRAQAVLIIMRRRRLHRLGEAFRCLLSHKMAATYSTKEKEARMAGLSRGLRDLGRVVARRKKRLVVSAFVRWRCFTAEVGTRSDRALLLFASKRAGAQSIGAILSRRELGMVSRAWIAWRSGVASAAVHDGERASADLRVSGARRLAGARLLVITLAAARRKAVMKAWRVWCRETKDSADSELRTMERHFHLARTLTRVERRTDLVSLGRAWRHWAKHARETVGLARSLGGARKAQLAHGLRRWRLACDKQRQAEANAGRASAEAALRGKAISVLIKRHRARLLREAFYRLFDHGAWAIFFSKKEAARNERVERGLHVLSRACARRRERGKLIAMGRWQRFASESRSQGERARFEAASRCAGAKALVSLVARREHARFARSWGVWRAGAASAAVHEDERAAADQRVFNARRSAGARLLLGVLSAARRRTLAKTWTVWCKEARAADIELQMFEKHFHLARTLTRVERRTQLARVGRAWRAWRELVRTEGEAELQALEKHFHVAQVVSRVVHRAQRRRVVRAWSVWTRLAARGARRETGSLAALPPGLLAAAWNVQAPTRAAQAVTTADSTAVTVAEQGELEQAERSRRVRHRAGAAAMRGLLRRADSRSLASGWQTWRGVTVAEAGRDARFLVGAMRLTTILGEVVDEHETGRLRQSWGKWVDWSTAEAMRLEQAAEAESWAIAEAEERAMKAARAGSALASAISRWDACVLRHYFDKWAGVSGARKNQELVTHVVAFMEQPQNPSVDHTMGGGQALGGKKIAAASPSSGLTALRLKLRGEGSPILPLSPKVPFDVKRSSEAARWSTNTSTRGTSPPWQQIRQRTSPLTPPKLVEGCESLTPVERQESPPARSGTAWWAGDSSGDSASFDAALLNENAWSPSQQAQEGTPSSSASFDEEGSLELSASPEQPDVKTLRTTSVGVFVASPHTGLLAAALRAGIEAVTTGGQAAASGSPTPSVAYTSESPLVGESVMQSRSDIMGMGNDDEWALFGTGLQRELSWLDNDDAVRRYGINSHVTRTVEIETTDCTVAANSSRLVGAPEQPLSGRNRMALSSGSVREWDSRQRRSPPYEHGSDQASPSRKRASSALVVVDDEEETGISMVNSNDSEESTFGAIGRVQQLVEAGSVADGEGEASSSDELGMSTAELFVKRIKIVMNRQALKRWIRVHRDAAYDMRMMTARKKVAFLRRQQKLRKVVVSALRRQSYAWHANDTSRAMRKWKEFVRRRREDDLLNLEISRITATSAFSPLTPRGARAYTAGLGRPYTGSRGATKRGYTGDDVGASAVDTRSICSPSLSPPTTNSARRWLWDQTG